MFAYLQYCNTGTRLMRTQYLIHIDTMHDQISAERTNEIDIPFKTGKLV